MLVLIGCSILLTLLAALNTCIFPLSCLVAKKMKKHEKLKKRKLQDPKMSLDGIVFPANDV